MPFSWEPGVFRERFQLAFLLRGSDLLVRACRTRSSVAEFGELFEFLLFLVVVVELLAYHISYSLEKRKNYFLFLALS